jgi:type I restriction enzyme S subunit
MDETNDLPKFPPSWCTAILQEVTEVNPSLPLDDIANDTQVSFLPMKSVEEESGRFKASAVKKFIEVKKGYTPFVDGDVIFAKITPCMENGKAAVVENLINGIGFGSTEFHVLRPANELLSPQFLFFYVIQKSFRQEAQAKMTGSAGQKRVPTTFIQNAEIPLPPLPEQQRIVAKIEELFTKLDVGVDALKKARTQLGRYRQALLKAAVTGELTREWREAHKGELEPATDLLARIHRERRAKWEADQLTKMEAAGKPPKNGDWKRKYQEPSAPDTSELPIIDGWQWVTLETVAEAIDPQPSHRTPPEVSNGVPYVGMGDVTKEKKIDLVNARKVSADVLAEHKQRYQLKEGDFFIGKIGTIGKPVKLTPPFEYALSANIVLIQPEPTYTEEKFAFLYMASPLVEKLLTAGSRATTQAAFGIQKVRLLPYPLPSTDEQRKIVEEVERLLSIADAMERTIEQSLNQAERLRQAILQQAFTGKLVPQDPNDERASRLLERIREEHARKVEAPPKQKRKNNRQKQTAQPTFLS